MSSQLNHTNNKSITEENNDLETFSVSGLGGFPPIVFLNYKNKKTKEFSKANNNNDNIQNINKLNILNIKNILGV